MLALTFLPGTFLANLWSKLTFMFIRLIVCVLTICVSVSCFKDPPVTDQPPAEIITKVLVDNLVLPWEIFSGPGGDIWVSEKGGRISRVNTETGELTPVLNIDEVEVRGEGGLLGMVMTKPATENAFLFVAYNYLNSGQYQQKIVRYTYNNGTLTQPLLIHDNVAGAGIHNGCRMVISKDDKLFVTTGDASDQSLPQNIQSRNGKVLRLNLDGTIPSDNPDPSSPVWSFGHRNAQGLVFVNDSLFSSEHGPDSDDEINIIHRGGNYGWPDVKGVCDADEQTFCEENNVIEPLMKWTPTIAVCGLDYYTGDAIPQWKNSLLMCTLKGSKLVQLQLDGSGIAIGATRDYFADQFGRLRDVCFAENGKVYICTSNGTDDKIIEVSGKE